MKQSWLFNISCGHLTDADTVFSRLDRESERQGASSSKQLRN